MENSSDKLISFCIPNFNYGNYIDATLNSLSQQNDKDFEVVISDNCSTDNSIEVIKKWESNFKYFRYTQNKVNIGFGGNLDKASKLATGIYIVMLSSDDLVEADAVFEYKKFIKIVEDKNPNEKFFFGGQPKMIDSEGQFIQNMNKGNQLWFETDIDKSLSDDMGFKVYKVPSHEMLRRCLINFKTPLHFITVCYQHASYLAVEGYGGARLYNPDKWFHWKLMVEVDFVYYLDSPLFQYRWHNNNQANQQQQNQILKYWIDEYRNCFEVTNEMLNKSGLSSGSIAQNFTDRCIIPYVYKHLKEGNRLLAKRILHFGLSCYPTQLKKNKFYYPMYILCGIPFSNLLLSKFNK